MIFISGERISRIFVGGDEIAKAVIAGNVVFQKESQLAPVLPPYEFPASLMIKAYDYNEMTEFKRTDSPQSFPVSFPVEYHYGQSCGMTVSKRGYELVDNFIDDWMITGVPPQKKFLFSPWSISHDEWRWDYDGTPANFACGGDASIPLAIDYPVSVSFANPKGGAAVSLEYRKSSDPTGSYCDYVSEDGTRLSYDRVSHRYEISDSGGNPVFRSERSGSSDEASGDMFQKTGLDGKWRELSSGSYVTIDFTVRTIWDLLPD